MSSGVQEPWGGPACLLRASELLSPSPPACVFTGVVFLLCFQSACSDHLFLFSCHGEPGSLCSGSGLVFQGSGFLWPAPTPTPHLSGGGLALMGAVDTREGGLLLNIRFPSGHVLCY